MMLIEKNWNLTAKNRIKDILSKGGVIAFPTETVYGLMAFYSQTDAHKKIFEIKQRPKNKQFQILIKEISMIEYFFGFTLCKKAKLIAQHFWAGALTLIVYNNDKSYGFRIPKHILTYELLDFLKEPLVATSCNLHSKKDCTKFSDIELSLGEILPNLAFDGGECFYKIPSTVLEIRDGEVNIIREGSIKKEDIWAVLEML